MQADRSLRSVFVGNIPYDATEERLRDIFSAVGPTLSFRIVYDRETGKPKGYGFCEYKDEETATSAIRNLNGYDLGGRQLRVDSASNERARDEPDNAASKNDIPQQQHQLPNTLQQQAVPEPLVDAPTVINNVMCSLPPEQLFDLCKQLKTSLLVNPNDTRQLLIHNPQLSYAMLQALVMIKAIDAQTALETLHQQLLQPNQLQPTMPLLAPIAPTLGPTASAGAGPMVVPAQPMSGAPMPGQPMMIPGPQVMNPFGYMMPTGPAAGAGPQQPIPAPIPPVSMTSITPVVTTTTSAPAPADPRLARQQQQQQQQQQSQPQQQQTQSNMSEIEYQSFIMQVMRMTDQEISLLPPDQREKVSDIRRHYSLAP